MRQQTILGRRYALGDELGKGGVGVVYVGRDLETGRAVAVKVLRPEHTSDEEALARFEQEARIARHLSHENIARVYDFGRDGESRYIVLELLGPTLKDLLKQRTRLPVRSAVDITRQVLAGLGAAHAAGIVHRDVKPQNILFADDPGPPGSLRVKLVDFGIARILNAQSHTAAGRFFGTPYYVSPEQALGQRVGPASDIYSAGIVLYELLTGVAPFDCASDFALLKKHIEEPPPPPSEVVSGIPPRLEAIVLRALEKQPERRWPDAESMRAALASYDAPLDPTPADKTRPFAAVDETRPWAAQPTASANGATKPLLGPLKGLPRGSASVGNGTIPLSSVAAAPKSAPTRIAGDRSAKGTRIGLFVLFVIGLALAVALGAIALRGFGPSASPRPAASATPARAATAGATAPRVLLPASAFGGGCLADTLPVRLVGVTVVLGQASECPRVVAQFNLAGRPSGAATLRLSALSSPLDAPDVAVLVNDRQVFKGKLALPETGDRGDALLPLPDGALRAGSNRIEIRNLAAGDQPVVGPWLVLFEAEVAWR